MNGATQGSSAKDFDFLLGRWRVSHRRLKRRLQGSTDWEVFRGTSEAWRLMNGAGNVDDNLIELPAGPYRAVSLRAFDPQTRQWAIWWLDGRAPAQIDVPVRGSFADGVGVFLADDTFEGRSRKPAETGGVAEEAAIMARPTVPGTTGRALDGERGGDHRANSAHALLDVIAETLAFRTPFSSSFPTFRHRPQRRPAPTSRWQQ